VGGLWWVAVADRSVSSSWKPNYLNRLLFGGCPRSGHKVWHVSAAKSMVDKYEEHGLYLQF